jgi:hypothetical protein
MPLHGAEDGVWCTTNETGIIRSIFFEAVSSKIYSRQFLALFLQNLCDEEKEHMFFQQDSAAAHTLFNTVATLCNIFHK